MGRKEGQPLMRPPARFLGALTLEGGCPQSSTAMGLCHTAKAWSSCAGQVGSEASQVLRLPCSPVALALEAYLPQSQVQSTHHCHLLASPGRAGKDSVQNFTPCFLLQKLGMSPSLWGPGSQACAGRFGWRLGGRSGLSKAPQSPPST